MNRKIKTRKEIEKEIESIFSESKNETILAKRIKSYLKSITGKEIITKSEIESFIITKIWFMDYETGTNLRNFKGLIKIFPGLNNYDKINLMLNAPLPDFHPLSHANSDDLVKDLVVDIALKCNAFKGLRLNEIEIFTLMNKLSENNSAYLRLCNFISDDYEVAVLLSDYVNSIRKMFHLGLIINKVIPLNSVLVYYDKNKDISENTQDLYILLNKKFTRIAIQSAIHDNLDNIRNGKISKYLIKILNI